MTQTKRFQGESKFEMQVMVTSISFGNVASLIIGEPLNTVSWRLKVKSIGDERLSLIGGAL